MSGDDDAAIRETADRVTDNVLSTLLAELRVLPSGAEPIAAAHATRVERLTELEERGARIATSTEQCRASTGAMRAEMATFAAAMQVTVNTPPRLADSHRGPMRLSTTRDTCAVPEAGAAPCGLATATVRGNCSPRASPASNGARIVIHARGHGPVGFVRLPLASEGSGGSGGGELAEDRSPHGEPVGATFAAVRAAISLQLPAVAQLLPAGACCRTVGSL